MNTKTLHSYPADEIIAMTIKDLPVCDVVPSVYRSKDNKIYIKTGEFVHKLAQYDEELKCWYPYGESIELNPESIVDVIQVGEDYIVDPNINRKFFVTMGIIIFLIVIALSSFLFLK